MRPRRVELCDLSTGERSMSLGRRAFSTLCVLVVRFERSVRHDGEVPGQDEPDLPRRLRDVRNCAENQTPAIRGEVTTLTSRIRAVVLDTRRCHGFALSWIRVPGIVCASLLWYVHSARTRTGACCQTHREFGQSGDGCGAGGGTNPHQVCLSSTFVDSGVCVASSRKSCSCAILHLGGGG